MAASSPPLLASGTTASSPAFRSFASARLGAARLHLRVALSGDLPLLAAIYASTRIEELQQVPWSAEQKKAFTDWQSAKQEEHYALHYPRAERLLIEVDRTGSKVRQRTAIGRIYVDTTSSEVRLMDITLLPDYRNKGLGTLVMNELLRYAGRLALCQVSLHVEPFNPAKRIYERMGFVVAETRGLYEFMICALPAPSLRDIR